jgi:hypothetical protein
MSRAWLLACALCLLPARAEAGGVELGARADALLFLIDRGPGVLPGGGLEVGYVPDLLDGRVRAALSWSMSGISVSLDGEDARVFSEKDTPAAEYSGTIGLMTVGLSFELAVRILPASARVSPYVVWRPRLMMIRTVSDLTVGEIELGRVREWKWYPTAEGGLGLEIGVGRGVIFTELSCGLFPLENHTVGHATSLSVVVSLGYRHVFQRR